MGELMKKQKVSKQNDLLDSKLKLKTKIISKIPELSSSHPDPGMRFGQNQLCNLIGRATWLQIE